MHTQTFNVYKAKLTLVGTRARQRPSYYGDDFQANSPAVRVQGDMYDVEMVRVGTVGAHNAADALVFAKAAGHVAPIIGETQPVVL